MNMNTLYLDITLAVLLVAILMAIALWKKYNYEKDVLGKIKAEIRLPSGRSMYYYKPCEEEAETVDINQFTYFLNPHLKRWHKHPSTPFLGMKWLQSDIRTECWDLNVATPVHSAPSPISASEINAKIRQIQAIRMVAEEQELQASNEMVKMAIANQPNKWVVYGIAGAGLVATIATLVIVAQVGGVI